MCIGDWRFGRLIRSVPRNITMVGPATDFIPHNNQRVGLQITMDAGSIGGGNGLQVLRGTTLVKLIFNIDPVFYVTLANDGDAPVHKYTLDPAGATITAMIIEWFLPEPVLTEALECLQRDYRSCNGLG